MRQPVGEHIEDDFIVGAHYGGMSAKCRPAEEGGRICGCGKGAFDDMKALGYQGNPVAWYFRRLGSETHQL